MRVSCVCVSVRVCTVLRIYVLALGIGLTLVRFFCVDIDT